MLKLNLGCGSERLPGFVNIDHRPCGDVVADVFTLAQFEPGTVDMIRASHILEHATFDRTSRILTRWLELLKPGGNLLVVVPNFSKVVNDFFRLYEAGDLSFEYFNSRIFGNETVAKNMYGESPLYCVKDNLFSQIIGLSTYDVAFHRAVFTKKGLLDLLVQAGFARFILTRQDTDGRKFSGKEFGVIAWKSTIEEI